MTNVPPGKVLEGGTGPAGPGLGHREGKVTSAAFDLHSHAPPFVLLYLS